MQYLLLQCPLQSVARDWWYTQDSIFVKFPDDVSRLEIFRASELISDFITQLLGKPHVLEFEKVYFPFVQWAKKRYAGLKFDAGDPDNGKLSFSGITAVRRDNFTYLADTVKQGLDKMLVDQAPVDDIVRWAIARVDRLWTREVEAEDFMSLAITKSISKPLEEYGVNGAATPGHVVAARKLSKRADTAVIAAGTRFATVMVTGMAKDKAGDKMR